MPGPQQSLALVTGASSGIGRAYARRLADGGTVVIAVGRREERLMELASEFPEGLIRPVVADLATAAGTDEVARMAAAEPVTMLVNNAGVAHYRAFADLPAEQLVELVGVKVAAPTRLTRAVVPGMLERGAGTIVNVAGMLAFSGPSPFEQVRLGRAVYVAGLAYEVALSQALAAELAGSGIRVQALCPGVVRTEFHERQGMDLSAVPRMSPEDVVSASLAGLELGEVVTAPGVERQELLEAVFSADLAAFGAQSPEPASRYRVQD